MQMTTVSTTTVHAASTTVSALEQVGVDVAGVQYGKDGSFFVILENGDAIDPFGVGGGTVKDVDPAGVGGGTVKNTDN